MSKTLSTFSPHSHTAVVRSQAEPRLIGPHNSTPLELSPMSMLHGPLQTNIAVVLRQQRPSERATGPQSTFSQASVHSPAGDILILLLKYHTRSSKLVPLGQTNEISVSSFRSFTRSSRSLFENYSASFLETVPPSTYGRHRNIEEIRYFKYRSTFYHHANIQTCLKLGHR